MAANDSGVVNVDGNKAVDTCGKRTRSNNVTDSDNEETMVNKSKKSNCELDNTSDLEGLPSTMEIEKKLDECKERATVECNLSDTEYSLPATGEIERRAANSSQASYMLSDLDCSLPSTQKITTLQRENINMQEQQKKKMFNSYTSSDNSRGATGSVAKEAVSPSSIVVNNFGNHAVHSNANQTLPNFSRISEDQRRVIIMKEEYGQGDGNNNSNANKISMFHRPEHFAKLIQESEFNKLPIKDIRVNHKSRLAAVELEVGIDTIDKTIINKILATKIIGDFKITCYIPNRDRYKCGVISPVGLESDLEKIKKEINRHISGKWEKIEKLQKKTQSGEFQPSVSVKLYFEGGILPTKIRIGYLQFAVRPYVYVPTQCFKCQRLWHTANNCKASTRCLKCAGNHNVEVCPSALEKCANCGGNHRASAKQCQVMAQAYKIEQFRANGLTFLEAKDRVLQQQEHASVGTATFPQLIQSSHARQMFKPTPTLSTSYRDVLRATVREEEPQGGNTERNLPHTGIGLLQQRTKKYADKGTQTQDTSGTHGNHQSLLSCNSFLIKLINAIEETYDRAVQNESKCIRKNIIYSCFKNNFQELPVMNASEQMSVNSEDEDSNTDWGEDHEHKSSLIQGKATRNRQMVNNVARSNGADMQLSQKATSTGNKTKKKLTKKK